MKLAAWCLSAAVAVASSACAEPALRVEAAKSAAQPATLPHRVLYRSATCGAGQASLESVAHAGALQSLVDGHTLRAAPSPLTAVDFSRESVFRLSMGALPTAGGDLVLTSVASTPGGLRIDAQRVLPDPGRLQAMVITQPCVIFSLPRGDYRQAQVVGADGQVWLSGDAPR